PAFFARPENGPARDSGYYPGERHLHRGADQSSRQPGVRRRGGNEADTSSLRGQVQDDTPARRDIESFVGNPDNSGNRGRTPGRDEPDLVSLLAGEYPFGRAGRDWALAHGLLQNYPDSRVYGAVSERNPGSS